MTGRIERELQAGEAVLWQGRPGLLGYGLSFWPLLVFGLIWTAGLLYGVLGDGPIHVDGGPGLGRRIDDPTEKFNATLIFQMVGLGLVLAVPIALMQAPFIAYGVTDRRLLLINDFPLWRSVRSVPWHQLAEVARHDRAHGRGDLTFIGPRWQAQSEEDVPRHAVLAIADVAAAEAAVQHARWNALERGSAS